MGIKIEIDLSEMGFEQDPETGEIYPGQSMEQAVINQIVARVAGTRDMTKLREKAERLIDSIITAEVKPLVQEILSQPIQKHEKYGSGKPIGDPVTIADLTMAAVEKFLTAPPRDSYNRNANNLGELVEDSVKAALATEFKPTIDAAKKEIRETVLTRAVAGAVAALTPPVR